MGAKSCILSTGPSRTDISLVFSLLRVWGNVPQGSPWLSVSVSVLSWVLLIPGVEGNLRTGLLSFADVPMSGGGGGRRVLWPFLHLDYGWTSCVCAERIHPKFVSLEQRMGSAPGRL